jgi:hypothetical protein
MIRRLEVLQWTGLLGAALVWAAQFVLGYGVAQANCRPGGARLGIDLRAWEISLTAVAGVLVLAAEAAALAVLAGTRGVEHTDPPPPGRQRFFAQAAALGNLLFLAIVLLSGLGALAHSACGQS